MPKNIMLENFIKDYFLFFNILLIFTAFFIQFVVIKQTREKNKWIRFVLFLAIEIFPVCQFMFDRKMASLHGSVYIESVIPWLGFMVLVGYIAAWYVYAVILERESGK